MSEYNNENRGAVWRNVKKMTDKHPDFTGRAVIGGVEYYVSVWKRGPNDNPNSSALRFSVTAVADVAQKGMQDAKKVMQPADGFEDDDIPF